MKASVDAGHAVTLPTTASIADGLMPVRPGDLTFAHVQAFVDAVVTVDDPAIVDAVLWIFAQRQDVAEPSGAATTAAVLAAPWTPPIKVDGPIVAIVSGGNMSLETLRGARGRGASSRLDAARMSRAQPARSRVHP